MTRNNENKNYFKQQQQNTYFENKKYIIYFEFMFFYTKTGVQLNSCISKYFEK